MHTSGSGAVGGWNHPMHRSCIPALQRGDRPDQAGAVSQALIRATVARSGRLPVAPTPTNAWA